MWRFSQITFGNFFFRQNNDSAKLHFGKTMIPCNDVLGKWWFGNKCAATGTFTLHEINYQISRKMKGNLLRGIIIMSLHTVPLIDFSWIVLHKKRVPRLGHNKTTRSSPHSCRECFLSQMIIDPVHTRCV